MGMWHGVLLVVMIGINLALILLALRKCVFFNHSWFDELKTIVSNDTHKCTILQILQRFQHDESAS